VLRPLLTSAPKVKPPREPAPGFNSSTTAATPMKINTVSRTYAPTMFAVAMLIAAIAVMAGNWLLVVAVVCSLLAGARLAHHHPSRRNRKLH
jgi:hypothetical protein